MKHRITVVVDKVNYAGKRKAVCECGWNGYSCFSETVAHKDGTLHLEAMLDNAQEQIDALKGTIAEKDIQIGWLKEARKVRSE